MKKRVTWPLPICVLLICAASQLAAATWPQFRGPNGSGIGSGDPPLEWDVESGKNIKWKTRIPGLAHSSPIVWDDRVIVTTAVSSTDETPTLETGWLSGSGDSAADSGEWTWKVICLDKATGKTVWERDACKGVPKVKRHAKASHANSTPATDGRHVVAFFASEGLYCYDMSGKLLWKKDLGVLKSGPYNAPNMEWGAASSPIIHAGKLILQCDASNDSYWASFDVATGKEIRRVARKDVTTWSTPTILEHAGRTQLICNGWKNMSGYDLESGKALWTLSGGGDVPVPTPQVANGTIFLTNGHGRSPIYAIRADAQGDLTPKEGSDKLPDGLVWFQSKHGSYMPTPLVLGNNLYVASDNGVIAAYDAETGKEHYRERLKGGGTFSASVVAAKERLYFVNEVGDTFVLKTGDTFEILTINSMNEPCMATPAICDDLLLIRGRDHLYCIGR